MDQKRILFTLIPKVDEILENNIIVELIDEIPRKVVMETIREELDELRRLIKEDEIDSEYMEDIVEKLALKIKENSKEKYSYKLKRVVNGTGVVIHTNIGRSLISPEIMDNVKDIAINYSNLEFNLETGERGSRYSHLEEIITKITGAESAMVVNNNAAAVMLVLSTLAKDKEVIVSRGELIEIGGSFRIPDVMEQSGAKLVDVGTTNKTHLRDFENAINEETGALLKVHTSNYRILGFTSNVSAEELKPLKEKYNLPIIEDLGSGVLVDLSKFGLEYEPTVQDSVAKDIDVMTFSGDKLLGGPQAGIIIGKKEYIEEMKRNPLTRAFRVDKFTISALEGVMQIYLDEKNITKRIPTLKMLSMTMDELNENSKKLYNILKENITEECINMEIVDDYSEVGGGSLPLEKIPTKCIRINLEENYSITKFERGLRYCEIPIITRLYKDNIYIDLRTVREEEFELVLNGIVYALETVKGVH